MKNTFRHIDDNVGARVEQLLEWLRIPSVSADPAFAKDCQKAAKWLVERLRGAGMTSAYEIETGGHPAVYAEWLGAPGKPTVLLYGH